MPIQNYNPKIFAEEMAKAASEAIPAEFTDNQKQFVIKTLLNFLNLAGDALNNDPKLSTVLNAEQATLITQFISEYTFHKSIDTIKGGVPEQLWGHILQNIAMIVFETAKQGVVNNASQEQIVQVVGQRVKETYQKMIQDMAAAGHIAADAVPVILSQSNADAWAQQQSQAQHTAAGQQPQGASAAPDDRKTLKLASVALVLQSLPSDSINKILSLFSQADADNILKLMNIPDLDKQIDSDMLNQTLQELKAFLPKNSADDQLEEDNDGPPPGYDHIKALTEKYLEKEILNVILFERKKIENFVTYCIKEDAKESLRVEFSPYIAKIIHGYLKDKLSA